jgi:HK97 family phage major capsid protein
MRQERGAEYNPEITLGAIVQAMRFGNGSREIRAALSEGLDTGGGFTVPSYMLGQLIDALRAKSVAFQAGARAVMLETGKPTSIATISGDATAAWRAENAAVTVSDMTFGAVSFTPRSLACLVIASDEVLEDSLNIDEAIRRSLSASLSGELDRVSLLGSGVAPEPKGIKNFAGVGNYSMGTNGAALADFAPFVEALGILQAANAEPPTACIIAPRTAKAMNLLKDTTNQPLQRPKAIADLPFLVTSRLPINDTQGGSSAASRAIMGNFSDLLIGIRHDLRLSILRERYAENLQTAIRCDLRADVALAHAASFTQVVGIL